jgi:hypothetical protein
MFCGLVAKLQQTQMVAPILMIINNIITEILIQYPIYSFCLTIGLRMEAASFQGYVTGLCCV